MPSTTIIDLTDECVNGGIDEPNKQEDDTSFVSSTSYSETINAYELEENRSKNRKSHVLCWDRTRVILKNPFGYSNFSDYIHANWIHGCKKKNKYIATQAPMKNTVDDFLDMAMQNSCCYIIVVTSIMEDNDENFYPYWPKEINMSFVYTRWCLKLNSKYSEPGYTKYFLEISHKKLPNVSRNITLYHYERWPAYERFHRCPRSSKFMATVLIDVNNHRNRDPAPIIVHGYFGHYRTLQYIILHEVMDLKIESGRDVPAATFLEISKIVFSMRYCQK